MPALVPPVAGRLSRRALLATTLATTLLAACASPSQAAGRTVDVEIVDRDTGQVLPVWWHHGRQYVAGRPGARYAIRLTNRSGGRVMLVTAVDGINVVTGRTAAWNQTGYVFAPWQSWDLTGWRKSDREVAAFEFTALPDSYAARTGRPLDVGVIGVAVFRERPAPVVLAPAPEPYERDAERRSDAAGASGATSAAPSAAPAAADRAPAKALAERQEAARSRLGTGHGEREVSEVSRTEFERASATPVEVISIQYDRWENLVAAGIIPPERVATQPRPFPGSRDGAGYVPDPPWR
jgi:hypothetical protein